MANATKRFYGKVGYAPTTVDQYGVARAAVTERSYFGDVLTLSTRWQNTENRNDDISVSHRISILADPYAFQNFPYIRYVTWMGTRWEVNTATVEYPRIILSLGGVYNGEPT